MFAPLKRLEGLKGFNPQKPIQMPQASLELPQLSATAPTSRTLNLNSPQVEDPELEDVPTVEAPKESATDSAPVSSPTIDYNGIKIKDEVEWGAKFAEPPEGLLDLLVSPTGVDTVNSATAYRNVPAGTQAFNVSKTTGKQINFGADFGAQKGQELVNPFKGEAKVVKPLGLSGAGNAVRLEYTTPDGQKVYADLNHNEANKVKVGQTVKPGQVVATAGASGNTSGVHSDFSVYALDGNNKPIYFDTSSRFKQG